jgi:hypothetical protein
MWGSLYASDSGNPQLCDASNACPPSMPPTSQSNGDHNKKNNGLIAIILGCLGGGLLIIFIIVVLLFCRHRTTPTNDGDMVPLQGVWSSCINFSYF